MATAPPPAAGAALAQNPVAAATTGVTGNNSAPINNNPTNPGTQPPVGSDPKSTIGSATAFKFTGGWFLLLACGATIFLSGTTVGPIFNGILTVGLLFQLEKLLKGQ